MKPVTFNSNLSTLHSLIKFYFEANGAIWDKPFKRTHADFICENRLSELITYCFLKSKHGEGLDVIKDWLNNRGMDSDKYEQLRGR